MSWATIQFRLNIDNSIFTYYLINFGFQLVGYSRIHWSSCRTRRHPPNYHTETLKVFFFFFCGWGGAVGIAIFFVQTEKNTEKNQKIVGQGGSMQCSCHPRCYKNSPGT